MDELTKYDLIEKYLSEEMDGEERRSFQKKIKEDNTLREELKLHQQIAETLRGKKIHDFRNNLQNTDNQWKRPVEKQNKSKFFGLNFTRTLAIAASLALLIFAWQFFFSDSANSAHSLFMAHHEPYQMVLNQRSSSENSADVDLLNSAIQQYSAGNFTQAAKLFEELRKNSQENIAYEFYWATSLLSANNAEEAIPVFENILAKPDHLFLEQSRWYLGLAYLENEEPQKAISIFKKIKEGEYKFSEKDVILKRIK